MVPAAVPDLSPIRGAFGPVFPPRPAAPVGPPRQALALRAAAADGDAAAAYSVAPVAFSALPFQ
jgi:hypothetical protein